MKMHRLPSVTPEEFTEAQQRLFRRITEGKRSRGRALEKFLTPEGGLRGPFNAWLYCPPVGEAAQRLGEVLRFESPIPPVLRELAILTVAAYWRADYEWWAHAKIARREGMDPNLIEDLHAGKPPRFKDPAEAAVHGFATELLRSRSVSDPVYREALSHLGQAGVAELVVLLGYYTLVAMTLNVFQVSVPEKD